MSHINQKQITYSRASASRRQGFKLLYQMPAANTGKRLNETAHRDRTHDMEEMWKVDVAESAFLSYSLSLQGAQ